MWHSHLNDTEIPETKRFIPKGYNIELADEVYPLHKVEKVETMAIQNSE